MKKLLTRRNMYFLLLPCIVFVAVARWRSETIIDFQAKLQVRQGQKASSNAENLENCDEEKRDVIFVKTHKTASSSVQNVLLR